MVWFLVAIHVSLLMMKMIISSTSTTSLERQRQQVIRQAGIIGKQCYKCRFLNDIDIV